MFVVIKFNGINVVNYMVPLTHEYSCGNRNPGIEACRRKKESIVSNIFLGRGNVATLISRSVTASDHKIHYSFLPPRGRLTYVVLISIVTL